MISKHIIDIRQIEIFGKMYCLKKPAKAIVKYEKFSNGIEYYTIRIKYFEMIFDFINIDNKYLSRMAKIVKNRLIKQLSPVIKQTNNINIYSI